MLKVATIVGTRPELIRLSRVIPLLDRHCDHKLIHTGQNYDYELNQIFFEDLGLRAPDRFLQVAGRTAAETIGNVIIAADAGARSAARGRRRSRRKPTAARARPAAPRPTPTHAGER